MALSKWIDIDSSHYDVNRLKWQSDFPLKIVLPASSEATFTQTCFRFDSAEHRFNVMPENRIVRSRNLLLS